MGTTEIAKLDGRRARGARTRDAIVSALFELVASESAAPTAQRIADKAGVSVRSVYQHFTDAEGLYADASERMHQRVAALRSPIDSSLPLNERIDEYVSQRSAVLEAVTPFSRSARMVEPTSKALRSSGEAFQRETRARLSQVFATELGALDNATRTLLLNALDVATSWTSWEYLRTRGHSVRSSRAVLRKTVSSLLNGDAG